MPERFDLGGAAFHLVIDSAKFGPELARNEQQARAAAQRITAALASIGSSGAGIGSGPAEGLKAVESAAQQAAVSVRRTSDQIRQLGTTQARITLAVDARGGVAEIARVKAELRGITTANAATIRIVGNASQFETTRRQVESEIRQLEQRGVNIRINAVAPRATTGGGGGFLQSDVASGVLRGFASGSGLGGGLILGGGFAAATGAAIAVQAVTGALKDGIGAGIQYNAQIELANNTLRLFTGSAQKADTALSFLRKYADTTIFDTEEVIAAGRIFISVADGNIAKLEQLIRLTGQLAATNPSAPGAGFEGATVAIRELLTGDTTSIAERFNVSRSALAEAKAQGQTGVELVQTAIKLAHGSEALVAAQGKTLLGQLSNFNSAVADAQRLATAGFTSVIGAQLPAATKAVRDAATGWAVLGAALAAIPAAAFAAVAALNAASSTASGVSNIPRGPQFDPNNPLVPLAPLSVLDPRTQQPLNLLPRSRGSAGIAAELREALTREPPATTVAKQTAEQIKAQEEQIKKLAAATADARQIELAGIQKLYQDSAAAVKENEATQKTSINAVRDAAISAAGVRRDSAIAGIEAEVTATSRARTLQDREIAAAQEATLRGLEATHTATIKGLDEQLAVIQKRSDAALKGFDAEIRAVDRKRDAALKALDAEARAEDRRHDQAVQNIDRERDRRLGLVDAQLDKLDAAAQRDERRQTDLQQRRTLSDARNDLRNADTPEARARARRAIADAEAAIARERVSRQREDARAALRVQADQIRAAADAAKTAENTRNQGTTDSIAGRKETAQDQAKADTERLNALKERVKVESDLEAQSVKDRITAENEGYQQTVRDQQDAFKQQQQQVDDQRYFEDQKIDERRKAVQVAYSKDTDDAKASADAQVANQEEITRVTLLEIDKRKRAAEQALLPPVTIAPSSQPGLPPRSAGLRNEDSVSGPFDPLGYWPDPAQLGGALDVAGLRAAAGEAVAAAAAEGITSPASQETVKASTIDLFKVSLPTPEQIAGAFGSLGSGISDGLVGALNSGAEAIKQATTDLIEGSVIKPARDALGIASPSTVFEAMAREIPPGFVQGLSGAETTIGPAMVAVFDAAWAQYLQPWFTGGDGLQTQLGVHFGNAAAGLDTTATEAAFGAGMFGALQGGYEQSVLPFFTAKDGLGAQLGVHFAVAAGQLNSATTQRAIGDAMRSAMTAGLNAAVSRQQEWWRIFEQVGENLGISTAKGFITYFNENPLSSPSVQGSGAGGSSTSSGGTTSFASSADGSVGTTGSISSGGSLAPSSAGNVAGAGQRFGQNDVEAYLVGKGWTPGTQGFNDSFDWMFDRQAKGYPPPLDMIVTGRAMGGFIKPWDWSWVGEQGPELIRAGRSGADVRSYADSLAMVGAGAGARGLTLNLTVNATGASIGNPDAFAARIKRETVSAVVNLLDAAERGAPDPAPPTLGGA